ncbi:MAG: carbohydrate porin [Alphaproteobacteria bacterium]|nr:carbohydrate porin [Alphaproteobacteria bacterium]
MKKIALVGLFTALSFAGNVQARSLSSDYSMFKYWLNKNYGIDYGIDASLMPQRGAPGGKYNAVQLYLYPYLTWTTHKNEYGSGSLNVAYTIIRYGNHNAANVGYRMGVVDDINDYSTNANEFDELYYSYQFAGKLDWLTIAVGQFPIYNFDGSPYNSNQQVNFINYALSQNASSTYAIAGVGAFVQITPKSDWSFAFGAQDASNVDAVSVRVNDLSDGHFTTFGQIQYAPTNKLGEAEFSVLLYNQPAVKLQPQTTNGWSINLSQNIGQKWNIFGRVNGVSGHMDTIEQSWSAGIVRLNPFERNELDQIGLAYAYNKINEEAVGEVLSHDAEQVIEAYWAIGISKWATITPDVQFYINPALNPKSDYGTAVSLRLTLFL